MADVFYKSTVFLPMLEEQTATFVLLALARALIGRRSVALMFRPREAIYSRSLPLRAKRLVLGWIKRMRDIQILTILPFQVDHRFSRVASGWIYDPQLWDADADCLARPGELTAEVKARASGRQVIIALGAQNAQKGFDYLSDIWGYAASLRETSFVVVAGKISERSQSAADRLREAGAMIIDRFIDDSELQQLYAAADLVWSAYAPDYDQASGIFGRAVQAGLPTVVRSGAYLEQLAVALDHPVIAVPWDAPGRAGNSLAKRPSRREASEVSARVSGMRSESLTRLETALGLVPGYPRAPE